MFSNPKFFRPLRHPLKKTPFFSEFLGCFGVAVPEKRPELFPKIGLEFQGGALLLRAEYVDNPQKETPLEVGRGFFRSKWLVGVLTPKKRKKERMEQHMALEPVSFPSNLRLNRWSRSPGVFCQVSLKRDQRNWDWRLKSSSWRWEMKIEWHSKFKDYTWLWGRRCKVTVRTK